MTDQPDNQPHNDTESAEVTEPIAADPAPTATEAKDVPRPSRWQRVRPTSRLSQIAATLVAVAAAVCIVAAVFVAGVFTGSERGDHHGHGREGSQNSSESAHHGRHGSGESDQDDSGQDGSRQDGSGQDGAGWDHKSDQHR
jgi:hypothetical protein